LWHAHAPQKNVRFKITGQDKGFNFKGINSVFLSESRNCGILMAKNISDSTSFKNKESEKSDSDKQFRI